MAWPLSTKALIPASNVTSRSKSSPSYHTEDPFFPERFAQEAQAIARLNHPNILQVYDLGEDKGFTYIVSPLVPGGTLQHKLTGEMMSCGTWARWPMPWISLTARVSSTGTSSREMSC